MLYFDQFNLKIIYSLLMMYYVMNHQLK